MHTLYVICQIVFYGMGYLFLWREVSWLLHTREELGKMEKFVLAFKKIADLRDSGTYTKEEVAFVSNKVLIKSLPIILMEFGYMLWTFLGLFTSYWWLFVAILFMSLLRKLFYEKVKGEQRILIERIDALFCTIVIAIILFFKLIF